MNGPHICMQESQGQQTENREMIRGWGAHDSPHTILYSASLSALLFGLLFGLLSIDTQVMAGTLGASPNGPVADISSMSVNLDHDTIYIETTPGETVAITVSDAQGIKATIAGLADENGQFRTWDHSWDPTPPQLSPGDWFTATTSSDQHTVSPAGDIRFQVDMDADLISGTIHAPWFAPQTLSVRCAVWTDPGPNPIEIPLVAADGGAFLCDFSGKWDLTPDQTIAVAYQEPDGDDLIRIYQPPWVRANYAHEWVGVNYAVGHTFWITLTDSAQQIKATSRMETGNGQGWGGDGFQTESGDWSTPYVDIQPYDQIYFSASDGYTNLLSVGQITGFQESAADRITGTISAPWWSGEATLDVECHPWGAPGGAPVKNSMAAPDGSSMYACQWDPHTEWDMQPGQEVGVMYVESDGDRVINVFQEPAPDLNIYKEVESESSMPGGRLIYRIQVDNWGQEVAESVRITDLLPAHTVYVSDSSPFSHTLSPGTVSWQVGTVQPNSQTEFYLTLGLLPELGVGSTLERNQVQIDTDTFEGNTDNNRFQVTQDIQVVDAHPTVGVDKTIRSGDPTPGETFLYGIHVWNNASIAVGPVTLTDTLPADASLVEWSSENNHPWQQSTGPDGTLVLTTPAIPGNWNGYLNVRMRLDSAVGLGVPLTNTVEIAVPHDENPADNIFVHTGAMTRQPFWDVGLDQQWGYGSLVPGGEANFQIYYRNGGNSTVHQVLLTDTLPLSLTFTGAFRDTHLGSIPFPPTREDGGELVWDLGDLPPGAEVGFRVQGRIDPAISPGTVLVNRAQIQTQDVDGYLENNGAIVTQSVSPAGPNLRVRKRGWWESTSQLHYTVDVENIGLGRIGAVTVTEQLPAMTTFTGQWWHNFWEGLTFIDQSGAGQLVWVLDHMDPSWHMTIDFILELDGAVVGEPGRSIANTVQASIPAGDVAPADNQSTFTLHSGPDLFVSKQLTAGIPRPGALLTFTVSFGNENSGPWGSGEPTILTDTLPPGMRFITATAPWDPGDFWQPTILADNRLQWQWGPMDAGNRWHFDIVTQISPTMEAGQVLTNTIEVASTVPTDVEWRYANNRDQAAVIVTTPRVEISKRITGSQIAGTPVTYTLALTNTGNEGDTDLVIEDPLPTGVAYQSGGAYDPDTGKVTWMLPDLAVDQQADLSFTGLITCSAGVSITNALYRVTESTLGMTSPFGPDVGFDVKAPSIQPAFAQSRSVVVAGESVIFTSTSTTDGPPITQWQWAIGDAGVGLGQTAAYTFTSAGVFTVTHHVIDTCGFSHTVTRTQAVTVTAPGTDLYLPVMRKP